MRCFVINLDRSPDRWSRIEKQLSGLNLSCERLSAVDGRALDDGVLRLQPASEVWKRMNKGEIACFMSHRTCWEKIAEGADEYGAVVEDDVLLAGHAASFLSSADWIPKHVGLLKIETFREKVFVSRTARSVKDGFKVYQLNSVHVGTGGYIVSKAYAKKLLSYSNEALPCPVDHFMFDPLLPSMGENAVHQLVPAICIQSVLVDDEKAALQSTIRPTGSERKEAFVKKKLTLGQKAFRELARLCQQLVALPALVVRHICYRQLIVRFG